MAELDMDKIVKDAINSLVIDGKSFLEWVQLIKEYKQKSQTGIKSTFVMVGNGNMIFTVEHEWISAKEPPKKWKNDDGTLINYLVYMPEYGVDVANYLQPVNTWVCMGLPCNVTHWMPLPEPPKED